MNKNELIKTVEKACFWALRNNQIYTIMSRPNNADEPYYITGWHRDYNSENEEGFVMIIDPTTARNVSPKRLVEENSRLTDSN